MNDGANLFNLLQKTSNFGSLNVEKEKSKRKLSSRRDQKKNGESKEDGTEIRSAKPLTLHVSSHNGVVFRHA
jgi:hypothetical protein